MDKVAVKLLRAKATNSDKEEFLSEAELMLLVSHPMVVKVCQDGTSLAGSMRRRWWACASRASRGCWWSSS